MDTHANYNVKGENFIFVSVHCDPVPLNEQKGEYGYFTLFTSSPRALLDLLPNFCFPPVSPGSGMSLSFCSFLCPRDSSTGLLGTLQNPRLAASGRIPRSALASLHRNPGTGPLGRCKCQMRPSPFLQCHSP